MASYLCLGSNYVVSYLIVVKNHHLRIANKHGNFYVSVYPSSSNLKHCLGSECMNIPDTSYGRVLSSTVFREK